MKQFEADLDRAFKVKVLGGLTKAMRGCAIVVDQSLVMNTPVRTGLASTNWLPSINTPRNETLPVGANQGVKAVIGKIKETDIIYFKNNVPYIEALENGHSQQAPNGFVKASIQRGVNSIR